VSQTRASSDTVLAFKRPDFNPIGSELSGLMTSQKVTLDNAYRAIASEILALGEPKFRSHPNIMKLLAVGWEIQRGRTWYLGKTTRVWPILIFEKAGLGTLGDFMKSDQGKALSLEDRGKICCDIASAIAFSHRKGKFPKLPQRSDQTD
jgi:serine/threonine protein kinase